jgi:hypothetical protein
MICFAIGADRSTSPPFQVEPINAAQALAIGGYLVTVGVNILHGTIALKIDALTLVEDITFVASYTLESTIIEPSTKLINQITLIVSIKIVPIWASGASSIIPFQTIIFLIYLTNTLLIQPITRITRRTNSFIINGSTFRIHHNTNPITIHPSPCRTFQTHTPFKLVAVGI